MVDRGASLDGRQPHDLTADKLLAHSRLPLGWHEQRTVLGIARAGLNSEPGHIATLTSLAHQWNHGRRNRPSRHCGTGKVPGRDVTGSWRDVDEPYCLCQPCRLVGPAHTAATAGFSIQEGEI